MKNTAKSSKSIKSWRCADGRRIQRRFGLFRTCFYNNWRATRPFGDTQHNFQNPDSKILKDDVLDIFVCNLNPLSSRAKRSSFFEQFRRWKFFKASRDRGDPRERFCGRNAKLTRPRVRSSLETPKDFDHEGRPLSLISC